MGSFKRILIVIFSGASLGCIAFGIHQTVHSNLFVLQNVEVESSIKHPPIDDLSLIRLASVPIGKVNLFELDLKKIEQRLLTNDWIREVRLQKRFLRTLFISVTFREPRAVIQASKGVLAYVDLDGRVFGSIDLLQASDLPLISGLSHQNSEKLKEALQLISKWEASPLGRIALVSSVSWDAERGYRLLASYPIGSSASTNRINSLSYARTMIDLGSEVDANLNEKLNQLVKVFRYLSGSSIAVRQIWADAGRKIVVKTVRGS